MKRIALLLPLLTLSLLVSCACPCKKRGPDAVQLFNGKDLAGWNFVLADPKARLEDVWSVRDGAILCKGEPMGYLCSTQSWLNYRLHVEYRWAPGKTPGNSGVFGRINGAPRPLPRCLETQLKHGDAGDLYCFHGMQLNGDSARFKFTPNHEIGGDLRGVKKITGNEKPAGEWNRVEVEVNGGNVTVWLNGLKVNEATGVEQVAGPVGLQSEGGEVHFRHVRLTPLPN